MTLLRSWALPVTMLALAGVGCDKQDSASHGAPPPPPVNAKPGACAGGGGRVGDAISATFFPPVVDAFCVDPATEVRTYGEQGKLDMDAVCTTAFDGECAVYNRFGLKRLVSLRYVDGAGAGSTVDVNLSRFADASGAYAMFTKRVVADSDPAEPTTPKPFAAGAAAAIGTGRAYVWKDAYLAELQYNNEQETPEALARSSAKALTTLGTAIGARLPGPRELPPSVAALPGEHRIASGLQLVLSDALGVSGLGPVAVGYYADGPVRYRLYAMAARDDQAGKDAWKLLRGRAGALPVAGVGDDGVAVTLAPSAPGGPSRDFVFARRGAFMAGVGDEELAAPADKATVGGLSKDDKVKKLKAWLATVPLAAKKVLDPNK